MPAPCRSSSPLFITPPPFRPSSSLFVIAPRCGRRGHRGGAAAAAVGERPASTPIGRLAAAAQTRARTGVACYQQSLRSIFLRKTSMSGDGGGERSCPGAGAGGGGGGGGGGARAAASAAALAAMTVPDTHSAVPWSSACTTRTRARSRTFGVETGSARCAPRMSHVCTRADRA